ncbi:MAG: Fe-S cluster assembly protein SufB [Thermoproteus sp.]|nr:Fe-S cluster assembly protein SufB [Thermoproteus sp.]
MEARDLDAVHAAISEADAAAEILGAAKPVPYAVELKGRITRDMVEELSRVKGEPDWMRRLRLKMLEVFEKLPTPRWVRGVGEIDLEALVHYAKPQVETTRSWDDLPREIREYYQKLGLPEMEAKALLGLATQFDSEIVYFNFKRKLEEKGVIMLPMDEAVKKYPDLVKQYFMRVFPPDHKFAALHGALWSGGTFIYVPPGVRIEQPLETFFLIGSSMESQMEHSLVVADRGSYVHWIEACAAPKLLRYSFHNGMVEGYAHEGANLKITTVQNWSRDIVNFNNKRAVAEAGARVQWVEGSIGSRTTYTFPSTVLKGEGASTEIYGITAANGGLWKENGAKAWHLAPNTKSRIVNKSISARGGTTVYRGVVYVAKGARYARSHVQCDALVLDGDSGNITIPHDQVFEETAVVTHEATASRISEEKLMYLRARGFTEDEAKAAVVLGFVSDIVKDLPFEYAVVLQRVLELEFSKLGRVG